MRVEEMKRQREERRKRAEEAKARRAVEAKDAESRGGIESVDFLRKIREYREANGIAGAPAMPFASRYSRILRRKSTDSMPPRDSASFASTARRAFASSARLRRSSR